MTLSLGIDLGTSGVRSAVVDGDGTVLSMARGTYGAQTGSRLNAETWWDGARECLTAQIADLRTKGIAPDAITCIGVDGTSGSMVLTDATSAPVTHALMYNDGGFDAEAAQIGLHAPVGHITRGANSALARLLHLKSMAPDATHLLHQADFIAARLIGQAGQSDENNALKTGFDPETGNWPDWFDDLGISSLLPQVHPAGSPVAQIDAVIAAKFGLSRNTVIHVGTTDSIAAFLAAAPLKTGAAVTSLGTTLAIKMMCDTRIEDASIGLYSHKLGGGWLVGGASNTGGGVLRQHFTDAQVAELSQRIDPTIPSELNYYPLTKPGERFPINDPDLQPRLEPRPDDPAAFLAGLLEGIARIEKDCFDAMIARGAPRPEPLLTAGGGAKNETWTRIRSRVLKQDVQIAEHTEAAIGTARLIGNVRQAG